MKGLLRIAPLPGPLITVLDAFTVAPRSPLVQLDCRGVRRHMEGGSPAIRPDGHTGRGRAVLFCPVIRGPLRHPAYGERITGVDLLVTWDVQPAEVSRRSEA